MNASTASSFEISGRKIKHGDDISSSKKSNGDSILVLFALLVNVSNAENQSTFRGLLETSSRLEEAPKSTCDYSDWRCTDTCLENLLEEEENALYTLHERWNLCVNAINICPECTAMGLSGDLNITWLRFGDLAVDPPPANCTNSTSPCSEVNKLNISLCVESGDPPAVCNNGSVNITYLATGGFAGQDCTSTEYLLGLPNAESMVDEVIALCAVLDEFTYAPTHPAVESGGKGQDSSAFFPSPNLSTVVQ